MIGLFFGETVFPKLILQSLKKKKLKYLIIDLSKNNIFKKNSNSYRVSIGQFGKILKILKEKKNTRKCATEYSYLNYII